MKRGFYAALLRFMEFRSGRARLVSEAKLLLREEFYFGAELWC